MMGLSQEHLTSSGFFWEKLLLPTFRMDATPYPQAWSLVQEALLCSPLATLPDPNPNSDPY